MTDVCEDLSELHQQLMIARRDAARAAAGMGVKLVAIGAAPGVQQLAAVTPVPRYLQIIERFGPVAPVSVCGCHVHVGVADRDTAVRVCNHLRPWLPTVQALCTNSPLHAGVDTGYASWRSVLFGQWPSTGPTPSCESEADYLALLDQLIDAGMMMDVGMAYWHARPSLNYPTVEVRIGDVCATAAEATLAAGLVRALVYAVLDDIATGKPAPRILHEVLIAAHWRAAHEGMTGTLLDAFTGRVKPAWDLVADLHAKAAEGLDCHGDREAVDRWLDRLRRNGTGADRQRRIFRETNDVGAVVAYLAVETILSAY